MLPASRLMASFASSFAALQLAFILAATILTILAEAPLFRWLGKIGWRPAFRAAALGLVPFYAVIFGSLWLMGTEFFRKHIEWTMVMALPIFGFLALLGLGWIAKAILQCRLAGMAAGLVVNVIVFPLLSSAFLTTKPSLWSLLESARPTVDLADAVVRGHQDYLVREIRTENAEEVFRHSLQALNAGAAALAIDHGIDPNKTVVVEPYPTPRTPLVIVLAYFWEGEQAAKQQALLRTLLEKGADPNLPSPCVVHYTGSPAEGKTETPLEVATRIGDAAVLRILEEAGVRSNGANGAP